MKFALHSLAAEARWASACTQPPCHPLGWSSGATGAPAGVTHGRPGPTALALPGGGFAAPQGEGLRRVTGPMRAAHERRLPWGELIHAHSFPKSRSAGSSRIYEPHPSLASAAIETPGGLGGPAEPGEAKHRRRHRAHEPAAGRGHPARASELRAPRQARFRGPRGASPCPR